MVGALEQGGTVGQGNWAKGLSLLVPWCAVPLACLATASTAWGVLAGFLVPGGVAV